MRARVAAFVLLAASLGVSAPARAVPAGCSGSFSGIGVSNGCVFEFKGFPLTVRGHSDSATPATAIVVWLEVELTRPTVSPVPASHRVPLIACAAARNSAADCSESAGPPAFPPNSLPFGAKLRCRATGVDHGTFSCSSGV